MDTTISQQRKRLNVLVAPKAKRRIMSAAGAQELDPGEVVSALAMEHLPAVPNEDAEREDDAQDAA